MFKQLTISAIALSLLVASLPAAKPTAVAGKIGTSIVQTVHRHPFWTSFFTLGGTLATLKMIKPDVKVPNPILLWLGGGVLLLAGAEALIKNFEIETLQ